MGGGKATLIDVPAVGGALPLGEIVAAADLYGFRGDSRRRIVEAVLDFDALWLAAEWASRRAFLDRYNA
ncbi:MAG: hypothetical protein K2Q06_06085 [Parvularculaceae bacterium]|nr:hypothetical protein [Parvularculaceae bacterium]